MTVHILLFKKNRLSLISRAISAITKSDITHSAVLRNDVLYDSSEGRGYFSRAEKKKLQDREVEIYQISVEPHLVNKWLVEHIDRKYDYRGVISWFLHYVFGGILPFSRTQSKRKVYCFEATASLLSLADNSEFPEFISGKDLQEALGKEPEYKGKLKDFKHIS